MRVKDECEERFGKEDKAVLPGCHQVYRIPAAQPRSRRSSSTVLRSSTSIGANYRKANRSVSRPDFGNKIGTVQKEASETHYWLELFVESNLIETPPVKLHAEASELLAIFSAIGKKKT